MKGDLSMRHLLLTAIILFVASLLSGCGAQQAAPAATAPAARSVELKVFAAASLNAVFKALGKNFEQANSDVAVSFNFAGSQQLAQQIGQGAPADVFAS